MLTTIQPEVNRIYTGDCVEIMNSWPDECVDLVLTDPPYGIDYQSNMRTKSPRFNKIANDNNDVRFEAYRVIVKKMRHDTTGIFFCSWKNYADDFNAIAPLLNIKNVLIWNKGGGGIGDLTHTLSTDYEMAIVADKGRAKIRGKRDGSVWAVTKENPNHMVHPTQKPLGILTRAMETFSDSGCVVLDPFAGSGSTLVAAQRLNRNFIGIEIDTEYVLAAEKRLADDRSQLKLF